MQIAIECPDQPDVIAMIAELDAFQHALYPPESCYGLDLASLKQSNVRFVVARDDAGQAIGCGAVVLYDGYGELKRMYVREHSRGKGVARKVLSVLEQSAGAAGYRDFKLETGPSQPAAIAFYASCGYARGERYGDYPDDEHSVFMHKSMAAAS